jgi:hypothetical protein
MVTLDKTRRRRREAAVYTFFHHPSLTFHVLFPLFLCISLSCHRSIQEWLSIPILTSCTPVSIDRKRAPDTPILAHEEETTNVLRYTSSRKILPLTRDRDTTQRVALAPRGRRASGESEQEVAPKPIGPCRVDSWKQTQRFKTFYTGRKGVDLDRHTLSWLSDRWHSRFAYGYSFELVSEMRDSSGGIKRVASCRFVAGRLSIVDDTIGSPSFHSPLIIIQCGCTLQFGCNRSSRHNIRNR